MFQSKNFQWLFSWKTRFLIPNDVCFEVNIYKAEAFLNRLYKIEMEHSVEQAITVLMRFSDYFPSLDAWCSCNKSMMSLCHVHISTWWFVFNVLVHDYAFATIWSLTSSSKSSRTIRVITIWERLYPSGFWGYFYGAQVQINFIKSLAQYPMLFKIKSFWVKP